MASRKRRPIPDNKKRRPGRSKKRPASSRKGFRSFIRIWFGVMVLTGALWAGYYFWSERAATGPGVTRQNASPKGPPVMMEITLYFPDDQSEYLQAERRRIARRSKASAMATAVLEALVSGPRSKLQPTIPKGTRIRRVSIGEHGICTVDFNQAFQKNHPGGTSGELMTVYSIVESLAANVPGIRSVQILVEGKPRETLAGHLFIGKPLQPNSRYIQRKRSAEIG